MLGFGKSSAMASEEAIDKPQPRKFWTFRKKLLVLAGVIIVIVGLALGLGLGLGLNRGDDDDDGGDDDGNNDGGDSGDGDVPENGPNRTETWRPDVEASWQIILKYPIDLSNGDDVTPDVEIYDLDLFDNTVEDFATLQDQGKKVICYFSAGSYEDWREDKDDWNEKDLGNDLDGWEGERWVNLTSETVHDVMRSRIKLAWRKGCDAIDPDNVDGFQNDNGLGLTPQDSVDFMRFLSDEAGKYNMSIGLKNAGDIIDDVLDVIDFSVNEQCAEFSECETFKPFIDDGKPVFHIEYPKGAPDDVSTQSKDDICSRKGKSKGAGKFSTVIKDMDLDGWVEYCDGDVFTTEIQN